jgi:Fur family ferric uptake transcriptional regulator
MTNDFLEKLKDCFKKNKIKLTNQRIIIAKVIENSDDHPDADKIFERAEKIDKTINLATVYRNLNLFEKFGLLKKHYFGSQKARYEIAFPHDHLIDVETGAVFEFEIPEIQETLNQILRSMGYNMLNYNLDVYAIKVFSSLKKIEDEEEID